MRFKHIFASISVMAGIATGQANIHDAHADDFQSITSELIQKKQDLSAEYLGHLITLRETGFSREEVEHMQRLLLHKAEFNRSGTIPPSHQLVTKKAQTTAVEMNQLSNVTAKELPQGDAKLIQQALLHKLNHIQNSNHFVTFN